MDVEFQLHGIAFVANRAKMAANANKHGVSFEQAAEAFFDPFLKVVDASRDHEVREAIIGMDTASQLIFVVHLVQEEDRIRLVSARKATKQERDIYEND
jgi:uncharacterized DUF497 family protein